MTIAGGNNVECPFCKLENPQESIHCDCGYNFRTGVVTRAVSGRQSRSAPVAATINTVLLAILVVMGGVLIASSRSSVKKWEYMIDAPDDSQFESRMNALGQQRWELVSARRATSSVSDGASYEIILKREKTN